MESKEVIELSLNQLYGIGDRTSLQFATMIRERIETDAQRRGFARRLLNTTFKGSAADNIEMLLGNSTERAQEMQDQITLAESNHYAREDRTLFDYIRANISASNVVESTWDEFTPQLFAQVRQIVSDKLIPVTRCVFSSRYWSGFVGNSSFSHLIDPVTRREQVLNGFLGSCIGLSLESDAFFHPILHFLQNDEMFFFGSPENLGKMEVLGREDGMTIVDLQDGSVEWQIPHNFRQFDLNLNAVSMLRMK